MSELPIHQLRTLLKPQNTGIQKTPAKLEVSKTRSLPQQRQRALFIRN